MLKNTVFFNIFTSGNCKQVRRNFFSSSRALVVPVHPLVNSVPKASIHRNFCSVFHLRRQPSFHPIPTSINLLRSSNLFFPFFFHFFVHSLFEWMTCLTTNLFCRYLRATVPQLRQPSAYTTLLALILLKSWLSSISLTLSGGGLPFSGVKVKDAGATIILLLPLCVTPSTRKYNKNLVGTFFEGFFSFHFCTKCRKVLVLLLILTLLKLVPSTSSSPPNFKVEHNSRPLRASRSISESKSFSTALRPAPQQGCNKAAWPRRGPFL